MNFDLRFCYDEEQTLENAPMLRDMYNETETGKYVFCEAKEDGATRLFLHQLCAYTDVLKKNGWWDTFTISEEPCQKGITLCSISKFTLDKNGFLMMVVVPVKYLGTSIDEDSAAWDYLHRSGRFSKMYVSDNHAFRWNEAALNEKFAELFQTEKALVLGHPLTAKMYQGDYVFFANVLLNEWLNENITLDDIANPLNEKFGIEKLAEDLCKNYHTYKTTRPLLVEKLPFQYGYISRMEVETYLQRKEWEYDDLLKKGLVNPVDHLFDKVEEICRFRNNEKEAKKAARKEARLAKKNK
jgi:hypothetical protein